MNVRNEESIELSGKKEVRLGMIIEWDVPIRMADGVVLRADIFRPEKEGRFPVLMSLGPYAKMLHFADGYTTAWEKMVGEHPDVVAGSTNAYQSWEVADPEKWVPHGYVCIRVDCRGAGRSPGYLEVWSPQETQDYAACIDWAGVQPWSSGKVGLSGISYYGANQWQVAAKRPTHLAAICVWEGFNDSYREMFFHGGIYCTFGQNWYDMQIKSVQNGKGTRGHRSRFTGEWVSGPETLTEEELGANRLDLWSEVLRHPLVDDFYKSRTARLSDIDVPVLSAANWGGQGLHPRGNFEGFVNSGSKNKWLEVHGIEHWTHYYTDYGIDIQRRFFDHFLKGEDNGWDREPKVRLQVRHPGERFEERFEEDWPIPRTQWTRFHIDPVTHSLESERTEETASVSFDALGDGITFVTPPLDEPTELTGPIAAKLHVSSTTKDADLFLVLRVFSADFSEITFIGALDPHTPVAQGWLRASHRKLDKEKTLPYRPYHSHDEIQPLTPGDVYELDIEVWPTSIVVPKGARIALSVRGRDYVYPGGSGGRLSNMKNEFTGCGPFLHDDPRDRPVELFGGRTTLHFGEGRENYILLPIVPPKDY
ncbi:CocE/NonD family hydrolase [Paraburkholderia sp. GAS348]|uniref:CocE/NonD family hydrolase n=1 Tax=Paraburkholderia sp. GAS348 TaxID=3035132 RepID=UPI003D237F38